MANLSSASNGVVQPETSERRWILIETCVVMAVLWLPRFVAEVDRYLQPLHAPPTRHLTLGYTTSAVAIGGQVLFMLFIIGSSDEGFSFFGFRKWKQTDATWLTVLLIPALVFMMVAYSVATKDVGAVHRVIKYPRALIPSYFIRGALSAIWEATVLRAYLSTRLRQLGDPSWLIITFSALATALMYISRGWPEVVLAIVMSVVYLAVFLRTRNVWLIALAQFVQFVILAYAVQVR